MRTSSALMVGAALAVELVAATNCAQAEVALRAALEVVGREQASVAAKCRRGRLASARRPARRRHRCCRRRSCTAGIRLQRPLGAQNSRASIDSRRVKSKGGVGHRSVLRGGGYSCRESNGKTRWNHQSLRRSFERDGFVVLPDFVPVERCEAHATGSARAGGARASRSSPEHLLDPLARARQPIATSPSPATRRACSSNPTASTRTAYRSLNRFAA